MCTGPIRQASVWLSLHVCRYGTCVYACARVWRVFACVCVCAYKGVCTSMCAVHVCVYMCGRAYYVYPAKFHSQTHHHHCIWSGDLDLGMRLANGPTSYCNGEAHAR